MTLVVALTGGLRALGLCHPMQERNATHFCLAALALALVWIPVGFHYPGDLPSLVAVAVAAMIARRESGEDGMIRGFVCALPVVGTIVGGALLLLRKYIDSLPPFTEQ